MKISGGFLAWLAISSFLSILVAPLSSAQAYQESWRIDNFPEGANTRNLTAVHSYNPSVKRIGSPFWVSASAWSDAEVTGMPDPLFFYRLDDAVGSTVAIDASNNGRHGTVAGTPTFGVAGEIGTALEFNGANDDRISLADEAALDATTFTLVGWVFVASPQPSAQPAIVDKRDSSGIPTAGWLLTYDAGANARFGFRNCNVTCTILSTPQNYPLGGIYHVAVTYASASTTAIIYVDGLNVASSTAMPSPANSASSVFFGSNVGLGSDFTGWLDHWQFYNSALTPQQIRFLASNSIPTYPWITSLEPTGCTLDNDTDSYGGQYQFTRAWLLSPTTDTCTWIGKIQYFDPGVGLNPAVNVYFTGSVLAENATTVSNGSQIIELSIPGVSLGETSVISVIIIVLLLVIGVWVWSRKDIVFMFLGASIVMIDGIIAVEYRNDWIGGRAFAVIILLFGGYLLIRGAVAYLMERRDRKSKAERDIGDSADV